MFVERRESPCDEQGLFISFKAAEGFFESADVVKLFNRSAVVIEEGKHLYGRTSPDFTGICPSTEEIPATV